MLMTRPMRQEMTAGWMPGIMNELFNELWPATTTPRHGDFVPAMNVREDEQNYTLELAVPGISRENLNIHLEPENVLCISGEHTHHGEKEEKADECNCKKDGRPNWLRREFCYRHFEQKLTMPDDVDAEAIGAALKDGILTLTLPKKKAQEIPEAKRIINIQ